MLIEPNVQTQSDATSGAVVEVHWRETGDQTERLLQSYEAAADALLAQCRTRASDGRWTEAERIAAEGAATYPDEPCFYTQWAWALHQQGKTAEGFEIVANAADRFPRSVTMAYCVACLNGALKRVPEAKRWLALAIERASNPDRVKLKSLRQPELQCIWGEPKLDVRL